ncbi:hypothetical protein AAC387_Pa05g0845 [Persea americana]
MRRSLVSFSDLPISISAPIFLHPTHLLQAPSSSRQTTTTIILSELPSKTHLTRPTSLSRPFPSFSPSHASASTPDDAHLPAAAARSPIAACPPQQPHATPSPALDTAKSLPFPDGIVINGDASSTSFTGDPGKTYMFRISNIGLSTSFNFRIQGHNMKLVEVEGSHTIQNIYTSLDVHVGQSLAVLVTLDQTPKDYYIVASTRFTRNILTTTAVLHYSNSRARVSGPLPTGPSYQVQWSLQQARTIRWNLTANAARPNPQGSFHYGTIQPSRTIILANSAPLLNRKQRYAVNRVSYVVPDTPLKLADNFNISGVFSFNTNQNAPTNGPAFLATPVMPASLHQFFEIVFQNNENTIQSWHLDG